MRPEYLVDVVLVDACARSTSTSPSITEGRWCREVPRRAGRPRSSRPTRPTPTSATSSGCRTRNRQGAVRVGWSSASTVVRRRCGSAAVPVATCSTPARPATLPRSRSALVLRRAAGRSACFVSVLEACAEAGQSQIRAVVVRGDGADWSSGLAIEVDVTTKAGVDRWVVAPGDTGATAAGVESVGGGQTITVALGRGSRADRSRMAA